MPFRMISMSLNQLLECTLECTYNFFCCHTFYDIRVQCSLQAILLSRDTDTEPELLTN